MFVIDASVAIKWFLTDEPFADESIRLLESNASLIAPDFLLVEVSNVAWKTVRQGRMTEITARAITDKLPSVFQMLSPTPLLIKKAVGISFSIGHPVYDCMYLSLSDLEGARLVTSDARLINKVINTQWEGSVVHIANALVH